jgi:hypothetical protein
MTTLSDKKQEFAEYFEKKSTEYKRMNCIAPPEEVALQIFNLYITCDSKAEKEKAAWMIYKLKDTYKKDLLRFIDIEELNKLLKNNVGR